MIDLISRKLALQASTNATTALTATSTRVPNLAILGAIGDGASAGSDQAGFEGAMSRIAASLTGAPTGSLDYAQYQTGAMIEPGIYDAGGLSQAGGSVRLVARVPGTVIIRIPAGQYFLTASGKINAVQVDGITFVGGKGAFKFTNTGNNVSLMHSFTRNFFYQYTEAAISNASDDHPYTTIRDNIFFGAAGSATVGIAWGGYLDQCIIENNGFLANAYHVKIGDRLGSTMIIARNSFLSWFGSASVNKTMADIWIVPNVTLAYGVNSGYGTTITGNKFGNEGQNPAAPRILIAPEDPASGTDRATRRPGTNDLGFVTQLIITDNVISGGETITAPVIRSTISEVRNIEWRSNKSNGSPYSSIIEWPSSFAASYTNTNSDFTFTQADVAPGVVPALAFSNANFAQLHDFGGFFPGDPNSVPVWPVSDNPALSLLASGLASSARPGYGGATKARTADPYGGTDYDLVTVTPGGEQGLAMNLGAAAMGAGGMVFVDMALQRAPAQSLSQVTIAIVNFTTSTTAFTRTISLPSGVGRLQMPVYLPPSAAPASWQLRVYAAAPVITGTADQFVTGDWIVNTGGARMGRDRALARYPLLPRNRTMLGGGPATWPLGWSSLLANGLTGITLAVAGSGADANGYYTDVTIAGTATHAGNIYIFPEEGIDAGPRQIWALRWPMRLLSGDLAAGAGREGQSHISLGLAGFDATGRLVDDRQAAVQPERAFKVLGPPDFLGFAKSTATLRASLRIALPVNLRVMVNLRLYTPTIQRMN